MRKLYLVEEPDGSFIPYAVETPDTERRLLNAHPNARRVAQREFRAMGRDTSRQALDDLVSATLDELGGHANETHPATARDSPLNP